MRLFQPKYKDKSGKTKQVAIWWLEFRDPNGIVQRWGLATTNKDVADITASQIGSLNEWAKKGLASPDNLVKWVRGQEPKIRKKIEDAGLLPKEQVSQTRPLTEHLEDYINSLKRNSTVAYVYSMRVKLAKIIEGCGFKFWADVDGSKINDYFDKCCQNGLSNHTASNYITSARMFANWMKKQKRTNNIPEIQSIQYIKTEERAFELDEYRNLLKATRCGPTRGGMTGYERYVIYKLAVETGLRRNELNSLSLSSFSFEDCTVFLPAKDTKSRKGKGRDAVQCITSGTAELIKELAKDKMPNVKLFKIPNNSAEIIRKDCEAAGIKVDNYRGRIKFHSLRHTCGTFLAARGVLPKDLQEIMRHSDINLTMSVYTHTLRGSKADAINRLKDIEQEPTKTETA